MRCDPIQIECLYFLLCIAFVFFYWTRYFFSILCAQSFCSDRYFHFSLCNFSSKFLFFLYLYGHCFSLIFIFRFIYTFDIFFSCLYFCLFMGFGVSCVVDEVTIERRTHALSHLFKLSLVSVGVATGSIVVGVLVLVYSSGASFPIITGAPVWSGTVVMLSRLCNAYLSLSFWKTYIFHYKLWIVTNCSIL